MIKLKASIHLYSTESGEIYSFLKSFYEKDLRLENQLKWSQDFENPIEMNDMIGTFIENNDKYKINMWISLDKGVYINVTDHNVDKIIRYIYERFPY